MTKLKPDKNISGQDKSLVTSGDALPKNGIPYLDGRDFLKSIAPNEQFHGRERDDIALSNDFLNGDSDANPVKRSFNGNDGYDTIILPGQREDYDIELPKHYATDSSVASEIQYGDRVNLIHINGSTITLSNVERVVFDKDEKYQKSRQTLKELENDIASGKVDAMSNKELIKLAESGLTDQELEEAKLRSTPEYAEIMHNHVLEDQEALDSQALKTARAANPDIINYEPDYSSTIPHSAETRPLPDQTPAMTLPGLGN